MKANTKDIAIVSSQGLGDGLIQLVFAQNIARKLCANNIEVTLYQDHVFHLSSIINNCIVKPYPTASNMVAELSEYSAVLYDHGSKFAVQILSHEKKHPPHFIPYYVTRHKTQNKGLRSIFIDHIHATQMNELGVFANLNQSIRHPFKHHLSVNEHFAWFSKKYLDIDEYELTPLLNIPYTWKAQKFSKRVLIHPSSSMTSKNWSAKSFKALALALKQQGWEPQFTISPSERSSWIDQVDKRFLAPSFSSIFELSQYYYESSALIGNDSGNGHLASAMGLPVLSIFNRWKKSYPWRPSWSNNKVVSPWLPQSMVGENWSHYLTVDKVLKAFNALIHERYFLKPKPIRNESHFKFGSHT